MSKPVKSKYKNVRHLRAFSGSYNYWSGSVTLNGKSYNTNNYPFNEAGERQAAKEIDLILIRLGKSPVNILKKVEEG